MSRQPAPPRLEEQTQSFRGTAGQEVRLPYEWRRLREERFQ